MSFQFTWNMYARAQKRKCCGGTLLPLKNKQLIPDNTCNCPYKPQYEKGTRHFSGDFQRELDSISTENARVSDFASKLDANDVVIRLKHLKANNHDFKEYYGK